MLEVFDKNRNKLAILQNAFTIRETKKINAINLFSFSLPDTDPKNDFCQPFHYVRYNDGDLFRIMPSGYDESEAGVKKYECEHVIATLIDTVMFGFVSVGGLGYYTRGVLNYVLNRQRPNEKHWVLDECDFSRQFEYGWEQENLLAALFSIPNRFVDKYIWTFDTHVYPFKISLKLLDESRPPDHYIRKGHNRIQLIKNSEPRQICTRIFPVGAGEGVNALGIKEINGGLPYLQSPQEYIDKYGIVERVWVDRRYTVRDSLLESARAMLKELQEPLVAYEVKFRGSCELGDIVQIVDFQKTYITEIDIAHEEVPDVTIKVANRPTDIASTVADLADRQRIEMTYSQGATQIYADSIADNADGTYPVELRFYLPDTMININAVLCKIRLSAFRAYSKATSSGGSVQSSSSGGGGTSSSGGGGTVTTDQSRVTTADTSPYIGRTLSTDEQSGTGASHYHRYESYLPEHSHDFTHNHKLTFSAHTHTTSAHTHTVNTTHDHQITPVIQHFGGGSNFWLLINGEKKLYVNSANAEVDITEYLVKSGRIPRGVWHTIGVLPNTLSRAEISYNVQGFIQSRGDATV